MADPSGRQRMAHPYALRMVNSSLRTLQIPKQARRAVAPVLATLLMIAVAVAMSVIIFMWSQGFLSNTSGATGAQQGSQNQAAQSSISIETATFVPGADTQFKIFIRNVGAVAIKLGLLTISGIDANAQFKGSITLPFTDGTAGTVTGSDGAQATWTVTATGDGTVAKGALVTLTITRADAAGGLTSADKTAASSGDVVNAKATTSVGTFASAQFTVP